MPSPPSPSPSSFSLSLLPLLLPLLRPLSPSSGTVDPIEALAKVALAKNVGLHVDCCLGGFLVPFMDKAGFPLAPFETNPLRAPPQRSPRPVLEIQQATSQPLGDLAGGQPPCI